MIGLACSCFACLAAAQGSGESTSPKTILRLAVDDSISGRAIANARIELVGLAMIGRSDSAGRAYFDHVPVGYRRIRITAIGYLPISRLVAVSAPVIGDSSATLIDMFRAGQAMDTVRVTARSATRTAQVDGGGFDARRRKGFGHFIDADILDSEAWRATLGGIIQNHVPGVRDGGAKLFSLRSINACSFDVYVDGIHQSDKFALDDIDPGAVAGVEVYSASNIPPQFNGMANQHSSGQAACGVLVIWSRY